jgi:hypothetical protein
VPRPRPSRHLRPSRVAEGPGARLRIAAAVLLLILLVAVLAPRAAAEPSWQRPVAGEVTRGFDYAGDPFAAGRHRGVDLAAFPGEPVRSACAGRVVFAGTAGSSGPTVSVRCGAWRVAYLPLSSLAVRRGARVHRGARLGTAAAAGPHAGLHVGVRREGSRWAYVDPLRFFGPADSQPPVVPPGPRPMHRTTRPAPLLSPRGVPAHPPHTAPGMSPRAAPHRAPRTFSRPSLAPQPTHSAPTRPLVPQPRHSTPAPPLGPQPRHSAPTHPLAPWPAWAGLALVLAGASGAITVRRRRGGRAPAPARARVSSSSA